MNILNIVFLFIVLTEFRIFAESIQQLMRDPRKARIISRSGFGIVRNIVSVIFFFRQRTQRAFHRLLLLLAVVDTVHLVTSLLSFSLPTLCTSFLKNTYKYTLPYTLPLAQVIKLNSELLGSMFIMAV